MAALQQLDLVDSQGNSLASDRFKAYMWQLTTADPDGDPLIIPAFSDKSVQIYGGGDSDFGGGTLHLQGANHPSDPSWADLSDQTGNPIARTSASFDVVAQNPYQIRPSLTGSTDGNVLVVVAVRI